MANITRTQFKKRIEEMKDRLSDLYLDLESLKEDLDNEACEIEPYENKWDLTDQQEERKEWLENTSTQIEEVMYKVEEANDDLDYID